MMLLHGYFRSSAAYRCRIAFGLKGLSPEAHSVHLRKGEQKSEAYLALNPHGLVPALEIDGAVLTQSLAIIEWLEETHPEPALLPKNALDRAYVRSLAYAVACDIHPLQNLRVLSHVRQAYAQDQAGIDGWCQRWLGPGLTALETQINASGKAGRFCYGDTPTLADICLVPQLFSADRFHVDLTAMPTLRRIREACEALPAFHIAHPSRQPDYEA